MLGFEDVKWNFTKFLLDREGKPVKRYAPTVEPIYIEGDIIVLLSIYFFSTRN
jgi:glutathione peroxidase